MPAITPFLWFDDQAEEAASFYVSVFPGSAVLDVMRRPGAGPDEEVDYYWSALTEGGEEIACRWLKDRFGLRWQAVPTELGSILGDRYLSRAQT